MLQLSLGFQALYMCRHSVNALAGCRLNNGHVQCTGNMSREPGTVRGTARRPHFSLAIVCVCIYIYIYIYTLSVCVCVCVCVYIYIYI